MVTLEVSFYCDSSAYHDCGFVSESLVESCLFANCLSEMRNEIGNFTERYLESCLYLRYGPVRIHDEHVTVTLESSFKTPTELHSRQPPNDLIHNALDRSLSCRFFGCSSGFITDNKFHSSVL